MTTIAKFTEDLIKAIFRSENRADDEIKWHELEAIDVRTLNDIGLDRWRILLPAE